MNRCKHILFCVAAVLAILHNLTPHQHHSELSMAEHERQHQSTNIFDFIRSLFHEDFGNQYHLENITIGDTPLSISTDFTDLDTDNSLITPTFEGNNAPLDIDISHSSSLLVSTLIYFDTALKREKAYQSPILDSYLLRTVGLRAPPC